MQSLFLEKTEIDLTTKDFSLYNPFNINHIQQCKSNWCWAATGSMLRNFVLTNKQQISQFDFIRYRKPSMSVNDCNDSKTDGYNDPILPDHFFKLLKTNGVKLKTFDYSDINSLCIAAQKSPILISISFNKKNSDGHFEIISGYDKILDLIYINNPSRKKLKQMRPKKFIESKFDTNNHRARGLYNSKLI